MKFLYSLIFCLGAYSGFSQVPIVHRNDALSNMVARISTDSLEKYLDGLVSFGTRHSLSRDAADRGIEAARQFVLEKFRSFEINSAGRLSSKIDYFDLVPDGRRIDEETRMGNVMATLKGNDPQDDRVFVVSAHLDSRVSDIMNRESNAPGANDDGSGVVALIEMVRIMSNRPFPATIVFVAVSGEEQGLLGATHLAKKAKNEQCRC